MKFLLCEPASRKTWDVFGILRKEYPSAEILIWCRNSLESALSHWFYPNSKPINGAKLETDVEAPSLHSAYAIPIEDWFIDCLQALPQASRPHFAAPDPIQLQRCRDKKILYSLLHSSGVRAPAVYEQSELRALPPETELVLKPPLGSGSRGLEFLSAEGAATMTPEAIGDRFFSERIGLSNRVEGIFFLADHGHLISAYAHQRLLTWPAKAGVSVLSEVLDCPEALDFARQVVRATDYHGLGMIETLVDSQGKRCLIEINTRIWGSFLLSQCQETSLLTNYIYVCRNIQVDTTNRFAYFRFLFPLRAMLSPQGILHLLRALLDRRYLSSGFYHVPFSRSLLFPLIPTLRYVLRHAKSNI